MGIASPKDSQIWLQYYFPIASPRDSQIWLQYHFPIVSPKDSQIWLQYHFPIASPKDSQIWLQYHFPIVSPKHLHHFHQSPNRQKHRQKSFCARQESLNVLISQLKQDLKGIKPN